MPFKVASLKISIGTKRSETVLRDVQVWDLSANVQDKVRLSREYRGRFSAYVDMKKLPIWLSSSESPYQCFTRSSTTMTYFNSKLKYKNRGIVFECIPLADKLANPGCYVYFIFSRYSDTVRVLRVDLSFKSDIDLQIKQLKSTNANSTEQTDVDTDGDESDNVNSNLNKTRESSIDKFYTVSRQKSESTTTMVLQTVREKDKKIQLKDTISKLILGGLRLRSLSGTHSETQRVYKMTLSAAEFAHRNDLVKLQKGIIKEIPFEDLQETVESLLNLFTRS
ncbi:Mitochondrial morphogenesis protein SLD7 [Nakaseomyces bracarensis]|uniref:Mitochondrial morphogenesis protein SLD7 n=1 Tax=Nakaseomyces bracarensis TaxID=273131 RepID=A0ABR4NXD5_9SACH